jgi:hypothetical protein
LCAIEFEPEFLPFFKGIKMQEQLDTRKKGKQKTNCTREISDLQLETSERIAIAKSIPL